MKSHALKLFLFVSFIIITACGTQPAKTEKPSPDYPRPVTEQQLSLTEEAEKQLELAGDSDTELEQRQYRLQAARLYIEANNIKRANQQLEIIQKNVSDAGLTNKQAVTTAEADIAILTAEIAISEKNAVQANKTISAMTAITRNQQIRYYALKADLDFLTGKYMHAVDRRVQLDTYIIGEKNKNKNNQRIWASLSNLSSVQLNTQRTSNPTIKGWLDLARVMRSGQQNISQLENALLDWGTRHPAHPVGSLFLNEIIDDYQATVADKKHIAVILPLQGKLANISATIKNGLLSAYYSDTNATIKPVLHFYDSSDEQQTFQQLYQQAEDDGATNIIGPLDKIVINQLSQQRELDIPVLALNYAESSLEITENLYQFGLSPEDEARQVAELAIRQNKFRAAVFYPDSEWGQRLKAAFSKHYELMGGKVLSTKNYAANTNDYRRPIRALFNLDQSDIRRRRVENIIGAVTQSEPYRRQDLDMVFLAATPQSARGIMPAFKFHHAANLPVYSTSHVYAGKPDRDLDRDLNGLIFCDMPWILQNNSPLNQTFKQNWPKQKNFTRLFALGIDAYHLIYNLDYLDNKDYAFFEGQTGNIQLDEYNRITRKLLWAKFKNGKPVFFEPELSEIAILSNGVKRP